MSASQPEIVDLLEAAELPTSLVGGKAHGLGLLARAGFRVPSGFCLTTAGLPPVSPDDNGDVPPADLLPAHVIEEVEERWRRLAGPLGVAVRSSATTEDGTASSGAGQYLTVLHVRTFDELVAAIVACWRSQRDPAAAAYQERVGGAPGATAMAVVVQVMVHPEWAGVLFTSDAPRPADDVDGPMLVEAVPGLADALVDGAVEPTRAVLGACPPHYVLQHEIREGSAELPADVLDALGQCGYALRAALGVALDVEWAVDHSGLTLLQARPITARVPLPAPSAGEDEALPGACWARMSICDSWLTEPLSPLFATSLFPRLIDRWAANWGGPAASRAANPLIPHPMHAVVGGFAYLRFDFPLSRHPARALLLVARWLAFHLSAVERRWRDELAPTLERAVTRARDTDLRRATTAELLALVDDVEEASAAYWAVIGGLAWHWNTSEWLLTRLLRVLPRAHRPAAGDLLAGGDRASRRAELLLDKIASCPSDRRDELWADYLSRFGHLVHNLDLVEPTPMEDPSLLRAAASDRSARRTSLPDFVHRPAPLQPALPFPLRIVLGWARHWAEVRDDALFAFTSGWPSLRAAHLELGRRLVEDKVVDSADDVFYLTASELQDWAAADDGRPISHQAVVARRRWQRQTRAGVVPPDVVPSTARVRLFGIDITGLALFGSARRGSEDGDRLVGSPVSSGRYTGPARVVLHAADAGLLEPGEVLVVRQVSPAWAPMLARAAAVVADVGGALSHGSVVAREYGIPAVMGVGTATTRIETGQVVAVDGDQGTVKLSPSA